jgi:ABC-type sugar transport system permease subunit
VRRSSRTAFAIAWAVYAVTVILAWRKVLAVPDGRGDINGLLVATVAGALGLALLGSWLQDHERER